MKIKFIIYFIIIFYSISITKQDILSNNDSNLFFLSQEENTIKFNLTKYSSYFFYLNQTYAPEDKIYFWSKWSSMENTYLYYYYTNTQNIEELKKESKKKLDPTDPRDRKHDGYTYVSYDRFQIPLNKNYLRLVFVMYPKLNDKEYYIRAVFYDSSEMYTNYIYKFYLDYNRQYVIFNYRQKNFYNNSLNGHIFVNLNDSDCSLYSFNDINDLYLKKIKNNEIHLKGEKSKAFNYTSGDIYFVFAGFNIYSKRFYSFSITNNNEYYNITNDIKKYSNYSFHLKFPNTQNQYLTFCLFTHYYYYIYFDIAPNNLRINASFLTSDNKTITPVENKYYFLNTINNVLFKIFFDSENYFNELDVKIQKIDDIPNNIDNIIVATYITLAIIIIGAIQLLMFIIYLMKMKFENKNRNRALINQNQQLINL